MASSLNMFRFALLLVLSLCLLGHGAAKSLKKLNQTHEEDIDLQLIQEETKKESLRDVVHKAYPLRLFERFLESSKMSLTLSEYSDTPFTLFMPWDEAFEKLPFDWLKRLEQPMWALHLKQFLLHHMHRGGLSLDVLKQITSTVKITMMDGESIEIAKKHNRVRIDDVRYIAHTAASDGYAFMMDDILVPSFMEQTAFMVAPPNLALRWIKYVYLAGMEDLLSDPSTVGTFLVPSNDAFEAVDKDTIALWESASGKEELRRILTFHIVPETLITPGTLEGGRVSTHKTLVQNQSLQFHVLSDVLQVNTASAIKGDIVAANGVVHVIDQVLLPTKEIQVELDGTIKSSDMD